jgi:hypothetical protein
MSTKFKPYIIASSLASFIGKHPYQTQEKTFYDILNRDELYSRKIKKILSIERREPTQTLVRQVLQNPEIHEVIQASVAKCIHATETTSILEHTERTISDVVAKTFPTMNPMLQKQMVEEAIGTVQKTQGIQQEPKIVKLYETTNQTIVTQKNDKLYRKDMGFYILGGKTDGFLQESRRVLEIKSRMKDTIRPPPTYDIIQLQVYMELTDALEGELLERYPGIPSRSTIYVRNTAEWNILHNDIILAIEKLWSIIENDTELKRIVTENSISYP